MAGVSRSALAFALLILGGCATIVAPDEVKSLQDATGNLTGALKDADREQVDALVALKREEYRIAMAQGAASRLSTDCAGKMGALNDAVEDLLGRPYSSVASDRAFRQLREVAPCGVPGIALALPSLPAPEPVELDGAPVGSVAQTSLGKAARQLSAYTEALSDIATGESAGSVDAAQAELVASAKGLLGALKVGGPADAIIDLANQAISSLIAAKRNRATREFLDRMDPAMPFMMERLGSGARIAVLQAAINRARAAQALSEHGNRVLNSEGMVVLRGRDRVATAERMAQFDDLEARLAGYNNAFLALRQADPMIATRGFAEAHRALRDLYHDPRASRAAIAKGLAAFAESAAALAEALEKAGE